jgi:hypothetical protein
MRVRYTQEQLDQIRQRYPNEETKVISESNSIVDFKWVGIDGTQIGTTGGDIEFLRNRTLGQNYSQMIFDAK